METLEGYDIIEKIGEGGMGQVFRAVHRRLDRPVAIKRLAPHLSHNQDMLRRFLQEARLQARLSHPNVVNIFDLIENDQGIFLVMEYVEGQTARDMLIARGRIDAPEALLIAEGVLSGLAFMHKNGVVHRDIKPSNIMASTSGAIKVTDFGIARLVNEETGLTRFGSGIGTLHYMAPELIKSGEVSFSIDIYSLGATLHEMLSGAPPFTGNTDLEIMMGHLEKEPPELILPGDGESHVLCRDAVRRALAKTPDQRFPSAEAFLAEVRRIRQLMPKSPSLQGAALSPSDVNAAPRTPNPDQDRPTTFTSVSASAATSAAPVTPPGAGENMPAAPVAEKDASAASSAAAASAGDAAEAPPVMTAPPTSISAPPPPRVPAAKGGRALYLGAVAVILAGVALTFFLTSGEKTSPPAPASPTVAAPAAPPTAAPATSPAPTPVPNASDAVAPQKTAQAAPEAARQPSPSQAVPETVRKPAPSQPDPRTVRESPPTQAPETQAVKETAASPPPAASPGPTLEASPGPATSEEASAPAQQRPSPGQEVATAEPAAQTAQEPAPATPAQQRIVYVNAQDARIRAGADAESDILATLDIGTRLAVQGADGDWLRAQTPDGRTGFILARLTSDAPPAPPAPPQAPTRTAKPSARKPKQPTGADQGWKIVK